MPVGCKHERSSPTTRGRGNAANELNLVDARSGFYFEVATCGGHPDRERLQQASGPERSSSAKVAAGERAARGSGSGQADLFSQNVRVVEVPDVGREKVPIWNYARPG
jgi:hypothetical protein